MAFLVSIFTKGDQMVPVLNQLGTNCALLGSHDFGKQNIDYFKLLYYDCMIEVKICKIIW